MKKKILIFLFILVFTIFIFFVYVKFVSTKRLNVREYKIVDSNLNNDYYGLKIVHFGDIHYGKNIDKDYLNMVVDRINLLKPDIVIFTGDLIDKGTNITSDMKDDLVEVLTKINANLGKYAISGNEDNDEYPSIIKKANFTYLNDNFEYVYNGESPILISDMDSSSLENINSIYNILLVHEPDKVLNIDYSKYNLILGGHSHNGQIILPFIGPLFKFEGSKTYYKEFYDLGSSKLYITSGIGTSKINLRFNNRPSFNIYRLVNR